MSTPRAGAKRPLTQWGKPSKVAHNPGTAPETDTRRVSAASQSSVDKPLPEGPDSLQRRESEAVEEPISKRAKLSIGLHARFELPRHQGRPWVHYEKLLQMKQAGSVDLAINAASRIFAVKTVSIADRDSVVALHGVRHENIVQLHAAYLCDDIVYFVSDTMAISIHDIAVSPTAGLTLMDIATLSLHILRGVNFIHNTLHIAHGGIEAKNILLCYNGSVKIANIGEALLKRQHDMRQDIQAVGRTVGEVTEASILLTEDQRLEAESFCQECDEEGASNLLQHHLLSSARSTNYLLPHVRIAMLLKHDPVTLYPQALIASKQPE